MVAPVAKPSTTVAALAANRHRESQGKTLPAAAISRKRQA
jgi:hypothetical protein